MKKSFLPAILIVLTVCGLYGFANAQTLPEPYQEKLLNGLKVMVWNDPKSDKVTLKLRIHAGSMFDPKDKMGVMALLSDILFPDPQTRAYFEEDLEGKLEVVSNYDYIQINATGKADEFINILDTVRAGLVTTPITPENFTKIRDARLAAAKETAAKPGTIADQAAARRLLAEFPYGRPEYGSPESIAKIDRFDMVTAKEKFLDADNATLAIIGKVDPKFAVRAVKQLLGNWQKSDGIVPATFAQPDAPDTKTVLVDLPGEANAEVRFAVRGMASNDKDNAALMFWTVAAEKRLTGALPAECTTAKAAGQDGRSVFVTNQSHILPGMVLIKTSFPAENAGKCFTVFRATLDKLMTEKVVAADFSEAQKNIHQLADSGAGNLDVLSDLWLSSDTYKWGKPSDQLNLLKAATPADGDRAAARIFAKAPVVTVIAGDAAKIKPQFAANQFALNAEEESRIKKEITDFLTSWKAALEKRDVEALMKHYAPKLEFYRDEKDKDQAAVRADSEKEFAQYNNVRIELTRTALNPDSKDAADVVFDKSWNSSGKEMTSTGAVQQLLKLVKTGGAWQIVGEKDLKVYSIENKKIPPVKTVETPPKKP